VRSSESTAQQRNGYTGVPSEEHASRPWIKLQLTSASSPSHHHRAPPPWMSLLTRRPRAQCSTRIEIPPNVRNTLTRRLDATRPPHSRPPHHRCTVAVNAPPASHTLFPRHPSVHSPAPAAQARAIVQSTRGRARHPQQLAAGTAPHRLSRAAACLGTNKIGEGKRTSSPSPANKASHRPPRSSLPPSSAPAPLSSTRELDYRGPATDHG
jgi:hypothetical protein